MNGRNLISYCWARLLLEKYLGKMHYFLEKVVGDLSMGEKTTILDTRNQVQVVNNCTSPLISIIQVWFSCSTFVNAAKIPSSTHSTGDPDLDSAHTLKDGANSWGVSVTPNFPLFLKKLFAQFRAAFIFDYLLSLQECVNDCADEMKGRLWAIWHNHTDITLECQLLTLTLGVLRSNLRLLIPSIKGGGNHLKHENLDTVLIRPDPAICLTLIGSSLHRRHPRWPSFGFNFMSRSLSARPGN